MHDDINDSVNELFAPNNDKGGNDVGDRQSTFHINDDSFSQIKTKHDEMSPTQNKKGGSNAVRQRKSKGGYNEDHFEDMMQQNNAGKMPSMI